VPAVCEKTTIVELSEVTDVAADVLTAAVRSCRRRVGPRYRSETSFVAAPTAIVTLARGARLAVRRIARNVPSGVPVLLHPERRQIATPFVKSAGQVEDVRAVTRDRRSAARQPSP